MPRAQDNRYSFGDGGAMSTENETWVIEEGDRVIGKRAALAGGSLTPWDALVYALWEADYAMRNGESLKAADAHCGFHANGLRAAELLSLPVARELFALDLDRFEREYLDRFDGVCDEIRAAAPSDPADPGHAKGSGIDSE